MAIGDIYVVTVTGCTALVILKITALGLVQKLKFKISQWALEAAYASSCYHSLW